MSNAPTIDVEAEVAAYVALSEKIEQLQAEKANIVARLRGLGAGKHETSFGVNVTVSQPPRSFNADHAWNLLTEEQRAVCLSPDAKKIKAQLPPVLAEQCMVEGAGDARVTIK